jgi:hypothetical protein
MIKLKELLNDPIDNLIEKIKLSLMSYNDYSSWNDFIDHQEQGECQSIVSHIINEFPQAKKKFGEIERDISYTDENGDEQHLQTHHWIIINNIPLDFSKGTLKNVIKFENLYDVYLGNDLWRYN